MEDNKDGDNVKTEEKLDFSEIDFDVIRAREREEARRRLEEMERKQREAAEREQEPPPKTYSVEEHEEAKKDAFEKGREVGFNQATETQNQHIENMLEGLMPQIQDLVARDRARRLEQEKETIRIAFSVAKKVLPKVLQAVGKQEVENFVENMIVDHHEQPRMTLFVHPDMVEAVEKRLQEKAQSMPAVPEFKVLGSDDMVIQDCRIEWPNGGVERNSDSLVEEMEKLFNRFSDRVDKEKTKEKQSIEEHNKVSSTKSKEASPQKDNKEAISNSPDMHETAEKENMPEDAENTDQLDTDMPPKPSQETVEKKTRENPDDEQNKLDHGRAEMEKDLSDGSTEDKTDDNLTDNSREKEDE